MEECPRCDSIEFRKDGIVKEKQRFRCKMCNFRFTVSQIGNPPSKKRTAIILYLAGLDYRKIGRLINTSHVTVFNWLKDLDAPIKQIGREKLKDTPTDSMINYIKTIGDNKRNKGLLLIEFTDNTVDVMFSHTDQ
jgi:transposase